jgi:hypothetical protein
MLGITRHDGGLSLPVPQSVRHLQADWYPHFSAGCDDHVIDGVSAAPTFVKVEDKAGITKISNGEVMVQNRAGLDLAKVMLGVVDPQARDCRLRFNALSFPDVRRRRDNESAAHQQCGNIHQPTFSPSALFHGFRRPFPLRDNVHSLNKRHTPWNSERVSQVEVFVVVNVACPGHRERPADRCSVETRTAPQFHRRLWSIDHRIKVHG